MLVQPLLNQRVASIWSLATFFRYFCFYFKCHTCKLTFVSFCDFVVVVVSNWFLVTVHNLKFVFSTIRNRCIKQPTIGTVFQLVSSLTALTISPSSLSVFTSELRFECYDAHHLFTNAYDSPTHIINKITPPCNMRFFFSNYYCDMCLLSAICEQFFDWIVVVVVVFRWLLCLVENNRNQNAYKPICLALS